MALLDYIPTGEANAITTAELLQLTGIPSVRALRKEIQEAARFVRSKESRRREIGRAIRAAKKYIQETGGESVDR